MTERFLQRNIAGENRQQYPRDIESWPPFNADVRRGLYLAYGVSPAEKRAGIEPRDIWAETADWLLENKLLEGDVYDLGTSSAYFIEQLLKRGHNGNIKGYDNASTHFPILQQRLRNDYPNASIDLCHGDVASRKFISKKRNKADIVSGLFLAYHLGHSERLADVMADIGKPGSIAIFGGRGEENLGNLWGTAKHIAEKFDAVMPDENFYHHFPAEVMVKSVDDDPRFEIIDTIEQKGYNYYPNTDEGFFSFANGVATYLPLTKKLSDNKPLRFGEIREYLFGDFKQKYFDSLATEHEDHFPDPHDQTIVIAKVVK
jgi:SAM-dependent methyltransferase